MIPHVNAPAWFWNAHIGMEMELEANDWIGYGKWLIFMAPRLNAFIETNQIAGDENAVWMLETYIESVNKLMDPTYLRNAGKLEVVRDIYKRAKGLLESL